MVSRKQQGALRLSIVASKFPVLRALEEALDWLAAKPDAGSPEPSAAAQPCQPEPGFVDTQASWKDVSDLFTQTTPASPHDPCAPLQHPP